jgi:hypothetical protein
MASERKEKGDLEICMPLTPCPHADDDQLTDGNHQDLAEAAAQWRR